ncbi:hypothetical protein ROLI_029900 [Roseobacter fucihabitans]|uniref:Uncharacterized protein n=1 Tax=Roseobacter fucihabitans TaxID=1537242 RepID=A0ABZ2BV55_9RHOB|nr:hypothetical protein [Roseobacter litoralis]
MRCTSISHGCSLNSLAFQANTGMLEAGFITSGVQKLHRTFRTNDVQIPQIDAETGKLSSPWINHPRVRSMLSP